MADAPEVQPDSTETEMDTEAHILKEALAATVAVAALAGGAAVHAGTAKADDKKPATTQILTQNQQTATKSANATDAFVRS